MVSFPFYPPDEPSGKQSSPFCHEAAVQRARIRMTRIEAEYDLATFDLCSFRSWIARKRQRELYIIGWQMPMNMYGAWLAAEGRDFIFFDRNTPRLHQTHIQLHELSHMLLEHRTMEVGKESGLAYQGLMAHFASLLGNGPAQTTPLVNPILKRSVEARNTQEELEAEALSVMIQRRAQELQLRNEWQTPLSFSQNRFVLETYETLDWL